MITTERLILRQWQPEDLELFAKLNQDPRVMEYFPALKTREESEASIKRWSEHIRKHGWGIWAVALRKTGEFIGFIGFDPVLPGMPCAPAVEIGWRLAFDVWGHGYATEGARAVLAYGFDILGFEEIVSFAPLKNQRSRRVMEKLGMHHDAAGDFDHPRVPDGHPIKKHALYRLTKAQWRHLAKIKQRRQAFE